MTAKTKSKSKPAAADTLETAASLKAASSAWDVPIAILKASKAAGSPAFSPGGRINRTEFFSWLKTHESEAQGAVAADLAKADKQELEREKLKEQILLLRSRNASEERRTIPREEAKSEWMRAAAIMQEEFKQLMEPGLYRVAIGRAQSRIGNILED